ncbi:MAG: hypothetical protein QOJ92_2247 [Frankiales bacterium]|nr:hypothetical protein [Frankiales bacterium]
MNGVTTAIDFPGTRRLVRGRLIRNGGLALIGLMLLVAFEWGVIHYASDAADLRDSGATTSGTVVEVIHPAKDNLGAGSAMVSYDVEGKAYVEHVDLGDLASEYAVGDEVDVYYDRNDPAHMTIDDIDNQPAATVTLMVFALVLGSWFIVQGTWRFARWIRARRVLRRETWTRGAVIRPRIAGVPGRLAMLPDRSLVILPIYGGLRIRPPETAARTCGSQRLVLIGSDAGDWLILARRAKTRRQAARWLARWTRTGRPQP